MNPNQKNYGWRTRRAPAANSNSNKEERIREIVLSRMLPAGEGHVEYLVRRILKQEVGFVAIDEIAHVVLDLEIVRDLSRGRAPKFKVRD